jgi:protocatechuate 3,4-dioxygenase beta subunit
MTRHIDATLRHGGILAGKVASKAGRAVKGVCVGLFTNNGDYLTQVNLHHGAYQFRGLTTARYKVLFAPGCGNGGGSYLAQWWKEHGSFSRANPVHVRAGQTVSGIDGALVLGGVLTGTVRLGSSSGRPLAGMCVTAQAGSSLDGNFYLASTRHDGRYVMRGLPTGSYSVDFSPGCNNNGNYLSASYPRKVHVTVGKTRSGISAVLQPGGSISGVVTGLSGQPLAGVVAFADASDGNGNAACSGKTGAFDITQLPPGSYTIAYGGYCGAKGNYAPLYYPNQLDPTAAVPVRVGAAQRVTGIDGRMRPGATVTGTVTGRSGQPARGICVAVQQTGFSYIDSSVNAVLYGAEAETGKTGTYRVAGLGPGRYGVQFGPCGEQPYASRWFAGQAGAPIGDLVDVGTGATVSGISAVMPPGGAIAGQLRDRQGKPVQGACAQAVNLRTGQYTEQANDLFGSSYQLTGLAPGRYAVNFYSCLEGVGYASQWYRDRSGPRSATVVRVTAGHVSRAIDASLARGGVITGRATVAGTGTPVRYYCVEASTRSGSAFGWGETRRNGDYSVSGLATGSYRLTFGNCEPVRGTAASQTLPGTVRVTEPRTVTGVNVKLRVAGSISGHVLGGPRGSAGQGQVCVEADPVSPAGLQGSATTDYTGYYLIRSLLPGKYRVYFDTTGECDNSLDGLRPQWYEAAETRAAATLVTVTAGQVTPDISATLRDDGGISGTVTAAAGNAPLPGACVRAVPVGARAAGRDPSLTASATGTGDYQLTGLAPGQYKVRFSSGCGSTGYVTQWWMHASSAATATIITVHDGAVTAGINAALAK